MLPAVERRNDIQFYLARKTPYAQRLLMAFGLIVAGLALQIALIQSMFWVGFPLVLAGVLLLLTKGYQNVVKAKRSGKEWRPARRIEVERILEINKRQRSWDADAIDVTCGRGFFALLGAVVVVWLAFMSSANVAGELATIIVVNAGIMLLPFWFTGVRSILKNDKLVVKAEMLLKIENAFNNVKKENEQFQYQIQTAEATGQEAAIPQDVKALVAFPEGPPSFLGLQMQVSINSVQGKDYPYFYCVLVAKKEFGALIRKVNPPKEILIEPKSEADVHICVIRQRTTKNSGYHTKQRAALEIFAYALNEARRQLAGAAK